VQQALGAGLRFGFIAVSDTRTGQPGSYGLTAVLATSLSKSNLHAALKARRCYATTGARIVLRVRADNHEMGEVYTSSTGPTFTVNCTPPGNLQRIEVLKNNTVVYVFTRRRDRGARRRRPRPRPGPRLPSTTAAGTRRSSGRWRPDGAARVRRGRAATCRSPMRALARCCRRGSQDRTASG
jgi:hypothetical protein